jgi:hypothetical protein
MLKKGG